ncbi:uncharacterized protein LOC115818403 [Chanos chanos]|uniref:Uncharacterized protein LOC115818403 n=1 Tax=Chanos chanos TaxID=29144 RepID=A0A6J2W0D1_CHACN|nr:uncharacterized protein LOC115818403 [Chanos chanos]
MTDHKLLFLLRLINTTLFITVFILLSGVGGFDITVFSSYGQNITLPCKNVVYQNCSSTTWIYNNKTSGSIELVGQGKIKSENTERADRLSVGSDCSLNIHKVKARDAGLYTYRQFLHEGAGQTGVDYSVLLTVLRIHPSLKQTEIQTGKTVTLYCSLHSQYSHLTVELQDQDNKSEWRCQLTKGKETETSICLGPRWTVNCSG